MIKFGSLRGSIGHLILNSLRYLLEEKKPNDFLVISTPKNEISNFFVYKTIVKNFQNNRVNFNNSRVINFIYKALYKIKKKIPIFSNLLCNIEWLHHKNPKIEYGSNYNFDENFYNLVPELEIDPNDLDYFYNWINQNNIKKNFVCISARDSGFYNENVENPRNFNFKDYEQLIKMLISKNYSVIRMGRNYLDTYNLDNENYIELFKNEKNNLNLDLIETLLFKECNFIISGNSGIDAFAALFKKKNLYS